MQLGPMNPLSWGLPTIIEVWFRCFDAWNDVLCLGTYSFMTSSCFLNDVSINDREPCCLVIVPCEFAQKSRSPCVSCCEL